MTGTDMAAGVILSSPLQVRESVDAAGPTPDMVAKNQEEEAVGQNFG